MKTPLPPFPKTGNDWNALWEAKQSARASQHTASYWNERAHTYTNKDNPGSYTDMFLQLADIKPGDTVLDMGCGTGNLTIPLAEAGHHVIAADFSSGMLSKLEEAVQERGLQSLVEIKQLAWDDNWANAGIEEASCDVCIASRSIATLNLLHALSQLNYACKRRGCITLPCGTSPRTDDRMLEAIGFTVSPSFDNCYAIALLSALEQYPTMSYIPTTRNDEFESRDQAFHKCFQMAEGYAKDQGIKVNAQELTAKINQWLDAELVPNNKKTGSLTFKTPRKTAWAFIAWNKGAIPSPLQA